MQPVINSKLNSQELKDRVLEKLTKVGLRPEMMNRYPAGFGEWLNAAGFMLGKSRELALLGPLESLDSLRAVVNENYHPGLVVAAGMDEDGKMPLLAGRSLNAGLPTAYLCERFSCRSPGCSASAFFHQR